MQLLGVRHAAEDVREVFERQGDEVGKALDSVHDGEDVLGVHPGHLQQHVLWHGRDKH